MVKAPKFKPDLVVTFWYVALHVGCVGVFWAGEFRLGLTVLISTFFFRMFVLSAGYHRYFAHRAYRTSRFMQFGLALLGTLTMQRGPLWWAATHRAHHLHADDPKDLHSPHHQGFLYSHSGWFMDSKNQETDLSVVPDLAKFPELRFLDDPRISQIPILLYGLLLFVFFGWSGFVWGFFVSTVCLLHTTHWIQSMSHSYGGYRRFNNKDHSRNHLLLGLFSLGEYHNNHHFCASSARQGYVWWEIDISYFILRILHLLGIVWDIRDFPSKVKS
jgi:stearoyl-CoA desaturase (delta-9 desaturase)